MNSDPDERDKRAASYDSRPGINPRKSGGGDRPRKPYEKRDGDRPRKPYEKRDGDRGLRKPYENRDGERGPRKPYEKRDGDRPRKPYENRDGDRPRKPYDNRDGDRPQRPARQYDGDRPKRRFDDDRGPRRPYEKRDGDRGPRKPYDSRDGDRPRRPYEKRDGDRGARRPYDSRDGDRGPRAYENRDGDRPQRPARQYDGDRPKRRFDDDRGPRKSYDSRDGERGPRKTYESRDGDRGPRKPYDRRDGERAPRGSGRPGARPDRGGRERAEADERSPRVAGIPLTKSQVIEAPEVPEEITYGLLDRTVRARLRTLSKDNAEDVGRHLVMAGKLLDTDPELAYRHAQVAAQRGGRVDVVREATALTAYATGRYAEALREFRTVRRLGGAIEHLPLMADCERGLGRPERALAIAQEPDARALPRDAAIELRIVVAGARLDMGDPEAALLALDRIGATSDELRARIDEARVAVLRALGRDEEADELEASLPEPVEEEAEEEDIVLYDTAELPDPDPQHDAEPDGDQDAAEERR